MPHTRDIMIALSPSHPCTTVTFMGSSQTSAKTEIALNFMFGMIELAPDSMAIALPNHKLIKRFVKRFDKNAAEMPALFEKLRPKTRKDADSQEMKDFPGGTYYFGSAESPSDGASISARYIYGGEVDRFPADVAGEGRPDELLDTRRTMHGNASKAYWESSPGIESLSIIYKRFLDGDQSYRYVPCPHCGEMQRLVWPQMRWDEAKPERTHYVCVKNGCIIHEYDKARMLGNDAAEWRATFPERSHRHRSFQISALYCPVGLGKTWGDLATEYVAKCKDKNSLKVFINTRLGETFKDEGEKVDWERVKERAQPYALRVVPKHVLLIVAGADVQKNRFEVVISGFDRFGRMTVLDRRVLPANPENPADWEILEEYLKRPLVSETGSSLRPECVCVDSGYLGHLVVNFALQHRQERWYATKGTGNATRPLIGRPSKWNARRDGKTDVFGGEFYSLGEKHAKDWLYGNLQRDGKLDVEGNYVRKPEERFFTASNQLEDEFFQQLCAEVWDPHKQRYVKLPGQDRNETLDCVVLCYVAAMHPIIKMDRFDENEWNKREALHHGLTPVGKTADLFAIAPKDAADAKQRAIDQLAAVFGKTEVTHSDRYS